jgi:hypothetical protein
MKHIFLTLAIFSTLLLAAAYVLGLTIDDPQAGGYAPQPGKGLHVLTSLFALLSAALVHAIWLTYFMGTGRWMEETCRAYALSDDYQRENRSLKYATVPALFAAFLLLLAAGGLGAAVDTSVDFGGYSGPLIHLMVASIALGVNLAVNLLEYATIAQNHALIERVMHEVRQRRTERGLPT